MSDFSQPASLPAAGDALAADSQPLGPSIETHQPDAPAMINRDQVAEQVPAEQVQPDPLRPGHYLLPAGWVDRREAARRLRITPSTLGTWDSQGRLRHGQWVARSGGERGRIYPLAEVEALAQRLAQLRALPEGFVDLDEACRMFGVTPNAWLAWQRQGKVPPGRLGLSAKNKPRWTYPVAELKRLLQEMRADDKVWALGGTHGRHHIPQGLIRKGEAHRMFDVGPSTWSRWEREGLITCGRHFAGRHLKLYPRAEIERLLAECGKYTPPYPDPNQPDVWRVPLGGRDMRRREALIDAADLPLIKDLRFYWAQPEDQEHHGRVVTSMLGRTTLLHDIIMGVSDAKRVVAHRNGERLDCRRANLVVRTYSENHAAARKPKSICGRRPTSRFKGVCWNKSSGKWAAHIVKDQVTRRLGHFDDEIAAAKARDQAARELFGEHASLNFPDGIDARLEKERAEAA